MEIKTKDLWQGAYVLAEGGELEDVRLDKRGGKKEVIFIFTGPDVEGLVKVFQSGQALCNVTRLRASMFHLKDLVFSRLRD